MKRVGTVLSPLFYVRLTLAILAAVATVPLRWIAFYAGYLWTAARESFFDGEDKAVDEHEAIRRALGKPRRYEED